MAGHIDDVNFAYRVDVVHLTNGLLPVASKALVKLISNVSCSDRRGRRRPDHTRRLQVKVASLTGGSRGQSASHVRAFIKVGTKVSFIDVHVDLAVELGENILLIQQDVPSAEDWERVVAQTEAALGPVSVLVNNAGIVLLKEISAVNQNSVFLG